MPKLNTQNKEVKEYLLEVGRYWVREFDIDGWRLDVANEIDHQFWREFRQAVKELKPDLYILGEIWHDSMPWLRGDQFDAVMNYPFLTNVLNFFAKENITKQQFIENMTSVIQMYPSNVNEAAFNLVGSHDTPRILTECNNEIERMKLIYTFMMTFIGTPCIYYGDELGLSGVMDPGCRECMPWEEEHWNKEMRSHIQSLIKLRKEEKLLANAGIFSFLSHSEEDVCIAYSKKDENKTIVVIVNPTSKEASHSLPFDLKGKKLTDILKDSEFAAESDQLSVTVAPFGFEIISF
jgi:glycosidase